MSSRDTVSSHSLFDELSHDFPSLQVDWKLLAPADFLPTISAAETSGSLPDAVFIDNAMQADPVKHSMPVRLLAGIPRHKERGWWFLLNNAPDLPQAKAFLVWLEEPATWHPQSPQTHLLSLEQKTSISQTALRVMQDRLQSIQPSASQVDPSLASFDWNWNNSYYLRNLGAQQTPPSVLQIGGNNHLAFVTLASPVDTDEAIGTLHSFMLFRNDGDVWKLIFFDDNDSLDGVTRMFSRFDTLGITNNGAQTAASIVLRAPADEESLARSPKPWIVFTMSDAAEHLIGIESQYSDPHGQDWSPTRISWVVDPPDSSNTTRTLAPFGVGYQPHRWRVLAIDKTGSITLSGWRTINFTN